MIFLLVVNLMLGKLGLTHDGTRMILRGEFCQSIITGNLGGLNAKTAMIGTSSAYRRNVSVPMILWVERLVNSSGPSGLPRIILPLSAETLALGRHCFSKDPPRILVIFSK